MIGQINTIEQIIESLVDQIDDGYQCKIGTNPDDILIIELPLPGFSKDEINVFREDEQLFIRCESTREADAEVQYFREDYTIEPVEVVFTLHQKYTENFIAAESVDGILTIQITKNQPNVTSVRVQ